MNRELRDAIEALIRCAERATDADWIDEDSSAREIVRAVERYNDCVADLERLASEARRLLDWEDLREYQAGALPLPAHKVMRGGA